MKTETIVTRFAPSPTGYLHLGSAWSAMVGHRIAREAGGRFLLRIEDIDRTRCRPEFEAATLEDLAWLGLDWDGPVRRQSDHFDDFQAALDKLDADGLLYPCFCSRSEIAQATAGAAPGPDGPVYPGTCRRISATEREARLNAGMAHVLRLDMARALERTGQLDWTDRLKGETVARPERFGDVVLARKDSPTSYHLSVTVDDALQGINLVVRGMDLFDATDVHRLLQVLLDLPEPAYHHHGLILGADGRKFAKRDRSMTLRAMRENGLEPVEVRDLAERMALMGPDSSQTE